MLFKMKEKSKFRIIDEKPITAKKSYYYLLVNHTKLSKIILKMYHSLYL